MQDGFRQRIWPFRVLGVGIGPQFRMLRKINHELLSSEKAFRFRGYQDFEATVMLHELVNSPERFLLHSERFTISVMFSAIFGVRVARLEHPTMTALYEVWAGMLRCG
jgi:hypothetical protein